MQFSSGQDPGIPQWNIHLVRPHICGPVDFTNTSPQPSTTASTTADTPWTSQVYTRQLPCHTHSCAPTHNSFIFSAIRRLFILRIPNAIVLASQPMFEIETHLLEPHKFGPSTPHPATTTADTYWTSHVSIPPAPITTNVIMTCTLHFHPLHTPVIGLRFQLNIECSFLRGRIPVSHSGTPI